MARLLERRLHVSQEPSGWVEKFFSWQVNSGLKLNEDTALEVSAVIACIRNLAEDVAKLPLMMYERTGPKSRSPAPSHYLTRSCKRSPNNHQPHIYNIILI
jgi:phage portal protein BeeE